MPATQEISNRTVPARLIFGFIFLFIISAYVYEFELSVLHLYINIYTTLLLYVVFISIYIITRHFYMPFLFISLFVLLVYIVNQQIFEILRRGVTHQDVRYLFANWENIVFLSSYILDYLHLAKYKINFHVLSSIVVIASLLASFYVFEKRLLVYFTKISHVSVYSGSGWLPFSKPLLRIRHQFSLKHPLQKLLARYLFGGLILIVFLPTWYAGLLSLRPDSFLHIQSGWRHIGPIVGYAITFPWDVDIDKGGESTEVLARELLEKLEIETPRPNMQPDIILWLNESAFDPSELIPYFPALSDQFVDHAFNRMSCCTATDSLWSAHLNVGVYGGGTAVTEFELVSGARANWYGPGGQYAHYTLSPLIDRTVFKALSEVGYDVKVIYPISGRFFNARKAYAAYGAKSFQDPSDLGLRGGRIASGPLNDFIPDAELLGVVQQALVTNQL